MMAGLTCRRPPAHLASDITVPAAHVVGVKNLLSEEDLVPS